MPEYSGGSMRFIAFDLETTGTVPGVDAIVEIGAVRFVDGQIDAIYSTLVNPLKSIPAGASKVNGIYDEMVKDKPKIEDLLPSFTEFCQDDIMVAHNAAFDAQFLTSDYKKLELPTPRGVVLDTLPIARKIFPGLPNYKLGTLVQFLKIPSSEFHRAEADATYCGRLFIELYQRISVGGQLPKVENLVALTGKAEFKFPEIIRQPKQLDLMSLL